MKTIMALNPRIQMNNVTLLGTVKLGNRNIGFGVVDIERPSFNEETQYNQNHVLVQVLSFSCNFRDRAILLNNYSQLQNSNKKYLPFGSDFVGVIVAKGKNVKNLNIGDRVIPDCNYPGENVNLIGVVTNYASHGWLRVEKSRLIRISDFFNNAEAATLSIGLQTAMSMIRKSNAVIQKKKVAIFSARSATSVYLSQLLSILNVPAIGISTSKWSNKERLISGYKKVISTNALEVNTYDCIFDPFFDLNIRNAFKTLKNKGIYLTCGLHDQHPELLTSRSHDNLEQVCQSMILSILKNITIIGNCLGTHEDLINGLKLFEKYYVHPIVANEYSYQEGIKFIQQSLLDKRKFGKVVLNYKE